MKTMSSAIGLALLAASVILTSCQHAPQAPGNLSVLSRCALADDVGVRFWYVPPNSDSTQGPLIFLPVSSQDPQLDTKPAWILYVLLSDMHNVVRVLAQSQLEWQESTKSQPLVVDFLALPKLDGHNMDVVVSSPNASAAAKVKADQILPLLSQVYCGLKSTKARESLTVWLGAYDCSVDPPKHSAF